MKNDIIKILFNIDMPHLNKDGKWLPTWGGGPMKVVCLSDYHFEKLSLLNLPCKEAYPFIQLFTVPFRVEKEKIDWNWWNGCTHIDVDTKKYKGEMKIDWLEVEQMLISFLDTTYSTNFYMIQRSYSGNSFHIIFYFNCEKTHDNFLKATQLSINHVKNAFFKLGLQEVINYDNAIIDGCSDTYTQGLYMAANPVYFGSHTNSELYGECSELKYMTVPDFTKKQENKELREIQSNNFRFTSKDIRFNWIPNNISWVHGTRLAVGNFLLQLTGNETKALALYDLIVPYISGKGNEHSPKELKTLMKNQIKDAANWGISDFLLNFLCRIYGVSFKYLDSNYKIKKEISKQNKEKRIKIAMDDLDSIFKNIL